MNIHIQTLVNKAKELKSEGKLQQALACYSDAFDLLRAKKLGSDGSLPLITRGAVEEEI